jgi:hypothetical protein
MITIITLQLLTGCITSSFESSALIGSWTVSEFNFGYDECNLQQAITDATVIEYTFSQTLNTEGSNNYDTSFNYDTGNQFTPLAVPNENTFTDKCYFEGEEDPTFQCDFPVILVGYDSWKDNWSYQENSENQGCTLNFNGRTNGLFISENQVFVTGNLSVNCPAEEDTSDTEEQINLNCSSQYSYYWTKK